MNSAESTGIPTVEDTNFIDDGKPLKPLADPVIAFIFRSVEAGGDAMRGLANAILEDSNDKPISNILSIQPQRYQTGTGGRWYRLDVLAETEDNEIVLLEVQLKKQSIFNTRSMVYAMEPLQWRIEKGDDWDTIAQKMPRVISINLLNFEVRKNGINFHQVIEPVYREEPREVAEDHHIVHNIELPKFKKITPDFTNPLHLWLTAICRAQDENKTLWEVVNMEPELKTFQETNPPFSQFVNGYDIANADDETRRQYDRWRLEMGFHQIELNIRKAEGKAEGIAEGKAEEKVGIAIKLLELGDSVDKIALVTGLTIDEIEKLRDTEQG